MPPSPPPRSAMLVVAGGAAAVAGAVTVYLHRSRFDRRGKHGPPATEHRANPGADDYDEQLRRLWGGPAPKHYRGCFDEWPSRYPAPEGAVALVTGGTGGIGFYVAKLLAHVGYEVVLPGRAGFEAEDAGAAAAIRRAVPNAKVVVPEAKLDLGDFASVRAFASAVRSSYGRLDVLCLNAGRGGSKDDPRDESVDGHESIMQVNATGHLLLTVELLPLLRTSPAARVVSQSSGARHSAKPEKIRDIDGTDATAFSAFDQYCLSKACNALFTKALNERLAAQGIDNVVAVMSDPGFACTGVNFQHDLTKSLLGAVGGFTKVMHNLAGQHAADGALPMALAAVDPEAKRNDWYTAAQGLVGPPKRGDPRSEGKPAQEPLNDDVYPQALRDSFWSQACEHSRANL
mmetsp:Transcript_132946/g.413356  ORF Transcript_132946/g.413356 Transcript_132946/m.413356 type:complete len:402 (+) Transcript_132946:36-1241(+)